MGRVVHYFLFLLLGLLICSVSTERAEMGQKKEGYGTEKQLHSSSSISITQMDITTPITTVPTVNPTIPSSTTPAANPDSTPVSNPATTTTPTSSGASWCVASQTSSQTALQVALDYACGYGGADCSAIQPAGSCYNPNTLHDHASFAFNDYYQKNPVPTSCSFGGTAVVTSTDPSSGTCQYPSTSTSSSVLNTTNSNGATVFGSQPTSPSSSAVAIPGSLQQFLALACIKVLLLPRDQY
ncbi:hypothetical protein PVL29_015021 [Vitis rotundifolia]|uniref:X8 domain-containing protein n=1 Tax=Vitis rotundifolia TaxID=103349 RepID=A0AA38ZBH1_VITRO|nr:hypothetical protein PVL29_015021 [Vitis rotundifolia]